MLRSNSKSPGNHVVSPEEEKERLQWEGFAEKEGFKPRERVGDGKLITISITVSGINDLRGLSLPLHSLFRPQASCASRAARVIAA